MKSKNKNFLYNLVYQVLIIALPLITVPYISRVLGANNIGIYSYTYSIVYYFMLVSMLGINNYGARTIARESHDKKRLSIVFKEIYGLQLSLTIVMTITYIIFVMLIPYPNKNIMFVQTVYLVTVALDINWFFFGLEKFKITVTRNIVIKFLSFFLIIIFVRDKNDLVLYTLIMSFSALASQAFLWIFVKRELVKVKIDLKNILKHIKPCVILFIPVIAYGVYRIMDKTMIGALVGNFDLGNYENAEKIINIPLSIVSALGTVMLPHMAKDLGNIKSEIKETFELNFFLVIPIIIGLLLISNDLSEILFGKEFSLSGQILKLLAPSILFSSIASVIRTNYLIPNEKDTIYLVSTVLGAVCNLFLNIIFIPKFGALGACIGTVSAEFIVMIFQVFATRNNLNYKSVVPIFGMYLTKGAFSVFLPYFFARNIDNLYLRTVVIIVFSCLIYIFIHRKYILYDFLGKNKG
ncbi:MAG: flippase [Lachnospiraceae bacterium]|nr:flippase [Lachnospiraceae bacterium]